MGEITRRQFLRGSAAGLAIGSLGAGCAQIMGGGEVGPKKGPRVVVIGGGWGGSSAAKYVRLADPSIEVILYEPNRTFVSCPFSNLVLSGVRTIDSLTFDYSRLQKHGVQVRHETVTAIEPASRRVRVGDKSVEYDRLIVSPGVEFQWEQVEGLAQNQDKVLHAWN